MNASVGVVRAQGLGLVAVFEVAAVDSREQWGGREQNGGGRSLFRCLPRQCGGAARLELCQQVTVDVPPQVGADHSGHDGVDGDATTGSLPGGLNREQRVARFDCP
jgi:hypothetical protein